MKRKQSRLSDHGITGLRGKPLRYPVTEEERIYHLWKRRGFPKRIIKSPEKLSRFGITGLKERLIKAPIKRPVVEIGKPLDEQKKEFERYEDEWEKHIQTCHPDEYESEAEEEFYTSAMDVLGDKKLPWFIRKKKLKQIEEKYFETL